MNKYPARRVATQAPQAEIEFPKAEDYDLLLSSGPGGHEVYAAKITGGHPTYRFARDFLAQDDRVGGKRDSGVKFAGDGYYEVQDHRGSRSYLKVAGGKATPATLAEAEAAFPASGPEGRADARRPADDGYLDAMGAAADRGPGGESHVTREG